jgi:protein TonB
MDEADLKAPRSTRFAVLIAVILLHVAAILALIRAFAPDFTGQVTEQVLAAFTVTVTTPQPSPSPAPQARETSGAAAEVGRKARPRPVAAPSPKVAIAKQTAPKAASQGNDVTSGTADAGTGTGAGGQGSGTGSGTGGDGQGGGAQKLQKIAGDINSARDYPKSSRDKRIGDYVIVVLTVGTDGRVSDCRIRRASRDPEADAITCRLATQRFRFRPATDGNGNAVVSTYGWQQRWFYPGEKRE